MSAIVSDPVRLTRPIEREGEAIAEVRLVEPMAGQLRGLRQIDVVQMDVGAMLALLPRITRPMLSTIEVEALPPRDLLRLSQEVVLFFATARELEALTSPAASPTTSTTP